MAGEQEYDVVVIGSGAAGLSAALSAAVNGSRVLVTREVQSHRRYERALRRRHLGTVPSPSN